MLYSWLDLQTNKNLEFSRLKKTQDKYTVDRLKILKKYNTYEDFIKIKYLKFKSFLINDKISSLFSEDGKKMALVLNKYPYILNKNIKHYTLFSLKPLSYKELIDIFSSVPTENLLIHINDKKTRSIKNLWHCHIFVKIDLI